MQENGFSDEVKSSPEEKRNEIEPNNNNSNNPSFATKISSDKAYIESRITIPDNDSTGLSWRKLWAFTGPGFLISIAFLDPGSIQCDSQTGASTKYKLLWVVLWSTVLGFFVQWLSAKLGVVTGLHLAEVCYKEYSKLPRIFVWLMMEVAIIGSDMQEVIGTSIAIYLLSNKGIPVWIGVLITMVDAFTFLLLDKYGLRKLELLFALLITIMTVSFGYEFMVTSPDTKEIFKGLLVPGCEDCSSSNWLLGVGIVGAAVMPHNLYLHSGLVKSRAIDHSKPEKIKEANMYYFIETAVALAISLVINVWVVAVFAHGVYNKTNQDVRDVCYSANSTYFKEFEANEELIDMDIYKSGLFLGCKFGIVAMTIWGIGILAAGQSSTMTGCYAGQFAMEGFLNLTWSRWKRVLFTRMVAILPTFTVAFYSSIQELSGMNDLLNAIMSLQLPFAAIPVVAFTSNRRIMGEFTNSIYTRLLALVVLITVLGINAMFLSVQFMELIHSNSLVLVCVLIYSVFYVLICGYLIIHMINGMKTNQEIKTL